MSYTMARPTDRDSDPGAAAGASDEPASADPVAILDDPPADEPDLVVHEEPAPAPAGPGANLGASLTALGVAVFGIVVSVGLGLGSPSQPQPGTWPFVTSVVIGVLALAQLLVGRRGSGGERFSRASAVPVAGFVTLLGMVMLMPVIGFEIPSALLCFIWLKFLGRESWRSSVLGAVLIPTVFYLIFILALGTSIPHLF